MDTEVKDETTILERRESTVSDDGKEPDDQKSTSSKQTEEIEAKPLAPLLPKEKLEYLRKQSVEVGGTKVEGESLPRRNARFPEALVHYDNPEVRTLFENLKWAVKNWPDCPSFGYRDAKQANKPYVWLTYKEFFNRALDLASGFIKIGIKPHDKIGIYSINRLEWVLTENACNAFSMPTVAIYDTFGQSTIAYVINHAELPLVVCSADKTKKLLEIAEGCKTLKYIVQMEPLTEEQKAFKGTVQLLSLCDIEQDGKQSRAEPVPPKPTDLAVLMYTSGTTGPPKGVMHNHSNMIAAMAGLRNGIPPLQNNDVYISYLPLAHILERMAVTTIMHHGGSIGFYSGDARNLVEDIDMLKPTLLAGVPRVFERIYTKAMSGVQTSGLFKKLIFKMAYNKKKGAITSGRTVFEAAEKSTSFFNKLVFSKMKSKIGGRMRAILCGAAPLAPQIHEFLKVCFGCPVVIGYGLTETCAACTLSDIDDPNVAVCGPPLICTEVKLVDVPEMNYLTSNVPQCGEIWIRGPNLSVGYFKDEEKTKEDFTKDGWFKTGDVGRWNKDGTLSIIDRKKNIFKLSQGEYVAAEKLELVYGRSKFVSQVFVYGDSFTPFVIAVVVTEPTFLREWAEERKLPTDIASLSTNADLKKAILSDFGHLQKENDLQGFEAIKDVIISTVEFTPDNELVTPTMKLKRPQLKNYFKDQIVATYKANGIDI